MRRFKFWKKFLLIITLSSTCWSAIAFAYEGDIHQQLTFMAAKQMSRCDVLSGVQAGARLTALDTRYIVKANIAQASSNLFVRMFRWNYYNPGPEEAKAVLGIIDTRFSNHFNGLLDDLSESTQRQQRLRLFGRLVSYVQNVTSPSKVVPVFTGRWWRFSFSDRFDKFPVDVRRLQHALGEECPSLEPEYLEEDATIADAMNDLVQRTAQQTLLHVETPLDGFPATWTAYWKPATDQDEFGAYGSAGNSFGVRAEFACGDGDQCLLLRDDPLYLDFAHVQHLTAVRATIQAMLLMQLRERQKIRE